jgi:transposase
MIGSISMKEFEAIMTIDGSVDGDVFEVFVRHFLGPKIKPGDFVVLDNCRVHYNQKSLDYLKKLGAVIVFLPPYSPELNPIELAWSKIKSTLKRIKARTREALDRAIAAALEEISESDLTNWFNHTMSFAHEF